LAAKYLDEHEKLSKSLVNFYKRSCINNFLVGMYCTGEKYSHKHTDLILKAIGNDRFQDEHPDYDPDQIDRLKDSVGKLLDAKAPRAITEAVREILHMEKKS
jgi:hypothetical protein